MASKLTAQERYLSGLLPPGFVDNIKAKHRKERRKFVAGRARQERYENRKGERPHPIARVILELAEPGPSRQ